MLAFCGIGQAGGNIADIAAQVGFSSIAINFSQRDLDSLEHVQEKLRLLGSEGVGKQRDHAIGLMRNNWESTIEFIKQNFSQPSIEIIMIVFSTAGGSGSGVSPFVIEMLTEQMPDKTIVAVPILPSKNEVLVNQINTQEALDELSSLNVAVMPLDNHSLYYELGSNIPKNILYEEVNKRFIILLDKLVSYTERNSKNGVLDKKDLRQIFSTKGICIVSETHIDTTIHHNLKINDLIQKTWKQSIFTPIQYEQIIRAGVITDGCDKILENISYDKLFDTFTHMPLDLFEGNYDGNTDSVITILSGLNWIYNRVEEIDQIIEKQKSLLNTMNTNSYRSKNTNKNEIFDKVANIKPKTNQNRTVSDILSRYT